MKKIHLLLFAILFCFNANAQKNDLERSILDSILNKTEKYLYLDTLGILSNTIRIIDLPNFIKTDLRYYKKTPVIIKKFMPLNLNNGEYGDMIITSFKKHKNTIKLIIVLCVYKPNIINIQNPITIDFEFSVKNDIITQMIYKTTAIDE